MNILRSRTRVAGLSLLLTLPAAAQSPHPQQQPPGISTADLQTLQKQALEEAEAGKSEAAIRDYTLALDRDPGWKDGWWNLGALQYSANRFADATSTFTRVVQFAPNLGTAWALLGLSEFELRTFPEARQHLQTALSLGIPDDEETRRVATYHLALLEIRGGSFEQAADLLRSGSAASPISPQLRFALGLATLRVPLLPADVDPSQEAVLSAAGALAAHGDVALDDLPAFLSAYPETPYAHLAAANLLAHAGHDQQALADLHTETRISPASPLPWREISRIEQQLGHTVAARDATAKANALGDPQLPEQRILHLYAAAGTPAPEANASLWSQAMREYTAGQYAAAIADLKPLLKTQPGNGTGWAVLGLSEYALKDLPDARIHLERGDALGLSGSAASLREARYTLGLLLLRAGDFERATSVLAAALKANSQDAAIRKALGLCLLHRTESADPEPAHPESAHPESADPSKASDNTLVSTAGEIAALLQDSRYDQAFGLFKTLLATYPSAPFLHYAYGTALLSLSEFDRAATQFRAEIPLSPASSLPYLRLASVALRQHAPADALDPARKAIALAPDSADPHYLLGRALLETGDDPGALRELEIAGRLSPNSPEVHFNLARAYTRARMPEQAATERATFARLQQLTEAQKSRGANAIYAGPHDAADGVTRQAPPPAQP